ncbi:MAG: hypothetical protein Q7R35_07815 [Elusimicrobiota bacterium]|nr:hypothetical protein [Elusimicrobiota bacterium]
MTIKTKTILAGVVLNLILFIVVTSMPAFEELHHHWIFPVLGAVISLEWALAGGAFRASRPVSGYDLKAARAVILFLLGFLILMGVVRHQTILACFGRCSFKLALAAALAAAVYFGQARLKDDTFWNPARACTAGLACSLWAVFLVLFGLGLPQWKLDLVFLAAAAAGLLRRRSPAIKVVISSIAPILIIRRCFGEDGIIVLTLIMACAGVAAAGWTVKPPPAVKPE